MFACGIRKLGKFLLLEYKKNLESWVLECGIQLKQSGIPLMIGIQNPSYTDKYRNPVPAIAVKNLETLVCVSSSPKLIWVLLWFHCFKICVAQHWGGREHITVTTKVWGVNLKKFKRSGVCFNDLWRVLWNPEFKTVLNFLTWRE